MFLQGQERAAAIEGALSVCLNTHVSAFLFSSNYELRVIFIYIRNLGIFEYEPLFYIALLYLMLQSYCTFVEHLKCALWTRSGREQEGEGGRWAGPKERGDGPEVGVGLGSVSPSVF